MGLIPVLKDYTSYLIIKAELLITAIYLNTKVK